MTQHAKTVAEIYAAFGRDDIPGILAALREDVEWEHDAVDHGIPWLVPRQGRAQVARFFEALRALDIPGSSRSAFSPTTPWRPR